MFYVTIDRNDLYSTKVNLEESAITEVYSKGEENEYTMYSYSVSEANVINDNATFSLTTDFV